MAKKKIDYVLRSNLEVVDSRGHFNELLYSSKIIDFLDDSLPERRCDFDKNGVGEAINYSLYGWDADQAVGIVQVRHAYREHKKWHMSVRKTYVICGYNENGNPFRHPVSAGIVRSAVRKNSDPAKVVEAVQCWMWKVKPELLGLSRRQGDVLIVPEKSQNPAKNKEFTVLGNQVKIGGSHIITADEIIKIEGKEFIYAKNPVLQHAKGQHKDTSAPRNDSPWFTIRVADEVASWDFSERLGD